MKKFGDRVVVLLILMIQASSGGLASQLFSTAVISGSKSLPNLVADCKNSKSMTEGLLTQESNQVFSTLDNENCPELW